MKKILLTLLIATMTLACGQSWQEYRSFEGGYSVDFPGAPEEMTYPVATPAGTFTTTCAQSETMSTCYIVGYTNFPRWVVDNQGADSAVEGAMQGAVGNLEGELLSSKTIEIEGHPGREFEFRAPKEGVYGVGRIYLVDSTLYQVLAMQRDGFPGAFEPDRFLTSFRLRPQL